MSEVEDLRRRLAALELDPGQLGVLEDRCLPYINWLENASQRSRIVHYGLSLLALLAGLLIPALAGLDPDGPLRWVVFALGLVVAVSIGVDGRLNLQGRWLHYRRTAELMKSECWLFAALAGPYEGRTHRDAYPAFQAAFETFARQEVAAYVAGAALPAGGSTQTKP